MQKQSFAELVNQATLMAAGLRKYFGEVSKAGITMEFIEKLEKKTKEVIELNNEQEAIKAELKGKTAELDDAMIQFTAELTRARKSVKFSENQKNWVAYGVMDKR